MPPPKITDRSPQTLHQGDSQSPEKFLAACILVRRFALPIVAGFAVVSIISASYVGLNGNHVWRQSDSYSQILGMLGQPGLGPFGTFHGYAAIFDIPIYQAIVAALSTITGGEPLLIVRIFGAVLFVIFVFAGAKIAETMEPGAGQVLAALLATSPLYLHYFATPLPDLLSLACSAVAVMLLLVSSGHSARYWLALSLLVIGALIKAPVPFVFLAFYVTWTLVNWRSTLSGRRSRIRFGGLLAASLVAAIVAELIRFYINPKSLSFRWNFYFGLPSDRISGVTWKTAGIYAGEAFAFRWLTFAAVIALVLYLVLRRFEGFKLLLPLGVGFAAGWLVFTKLYVWHDYYGLPTTFMLLMAVSIAVRGFAGLIAQRVDLLSKAAPVLLILAVPLMIVYGHKISSYSVTSEGQAMRFILRDVRHFVYVSNEDPDDPSSEVGGLAAKPFTLVSPGEFERSCMEILHHERAVVINRSNVQGPSQCLSILRESAVSFMKGPQYQVLSW
jgi:hypothetical protein